MSNSNFQSPQPTPLETEAYLELATDPAIDVSAVDAEPDDTEDFALEATSLVQTEANSDGFLIARKLRQHNRELVKTVVQLEQALAESQAKLQAQITRSRSADTLINQQAEDLSGSQTQLSRLNRELEQAKQSAQTYQEMAVVLERKLQTSQIQLAQIERECSLLQESYNEQQQKLFAAEQEIQDLQIRLQRQQSFTLQYKSALEEQANLPEDIDIPSTNHQVPKVSRIQPWSEQLNQTPPKTQFGKVTPFPTAKAKPIAEIPSSEAAAVILPPDVNGNLEQQLEALELEMETMSKVVDEPVPPVVKAQPMPPQFPPLASIQPLSREMAIATKRHVVAPMTSNRNPLPQHKNWPSPTLNPLRPAKKLTSLASIDLPSFNRR